MIKELNINIPACFELDGLIAVSTIISPSSEDTGILVASENFDNCKVCDPTVRLYLLAQVDGIFEVTKELDAFTFSTIEEAQQFSQELPDMTALDLILYINNHKPLFSA